MALSLAVLSYLGLAMAMGTSNTSNGSVSFLTLGDWGGYDLGGFHQTTVTTVAKQMAETAEQNKASFVVNTGDNFYYCGITSTSDKQVADDFTNVYSAKSLQVPWYSVLGNHEYGYDVEAQCQLSKVLNNWVMDSRYFAKRVAISDNQHISFIFLDTSPCVSAYRGDDESQWDPCGSEFPTCDPIAEGPCKFHENILTQNCTAQFEWFTQALSKVPKEDWLLIVGHHPADEMDVEDFVTPMAKHGFDLYLNGHTHLLNQYTINGAGAYVTSGAGAMVQTADQDVEEDHLSSSTVQTVWEQKVAGFTLHTFSTDFQELKTQFLDYHGKVLHQFSVKRGKAPSPPPPSQGSCKSYGCGRFNPSHTCQCNSYCKQHGDCCSDFDSVCGGRGGLEQAFV
mmetsp:Transcript_69783/g.141287  ORF Transcript_69783/g.141287 Transcript_69783/m.141287 type:complete len:395 (-) Transcript_69783:152-1336(-)